MDNYDFPLPWPTNTCLFYCCSDRTNDYCSGVITTANKSNSPLAVAYHRLRRDAASCSWHQWVVLETCPPAILHRSAATKFFCHAVVKLFPRYATVITRRALNVAYNWLTVISVSYFNYWLGQTRQAACRWPRVAEVVWNDCAWMTGCCYWRFH